MYAHTEEKKTSQFQKAASAPLNGRANKKKQL